MASNKSVKELKVEDALMYLDMVKTEFSTQPQVYNEFLEIMKSFKSQQIDTPGVIRCVSNLFRGYAKLILGFNTFLPEGYKIEIPYEQVSTEGGDERKEQWVTMRHPGGGRTVVVRPEHYNVKPEGLDALHLPASIPAPNASGTALRAAGSGEPSALTSQAQGAGKQLVPVKPEMGGSTGGLSGATASLLGPGGVSTGLLSSAAAAAAKEAAARNPGHPVEFDHAIYYVTTVKRRFSNQPETYKSFLEILHTYQKEQRSIKEVLDQVSELFAEHPDLLKEFTYFLPDAVQEQAKERLQRAAREAELRRRRGGIRAVGKGRKRGAGPSRRGGGVAGLPKSPMGFQGADPFVLADASAGYFGLAGLTELEGLSAEDEALAARRMRVARSEAARQQASFVHPTEAALLAKIKSTLLASRRGPGLWHSFVKCLSLFCKQVFSREDMLRLSTDILGGEPGLLQQFRGLLGPPRDNEWADDEARLALPLAEMSFVECAVATPSYRAVPAAYPKQQSSARSALEKSVLNDAWVSLPVGSEENYSFKHMRKNQYEEALFKCEDDLFEVDMVIDATKHTIEVLERLLLSLRDTEDTAAAAARQLRAGSDSSAAEAEAEAASTTVNRAILAARRSWRPDGSVLRSFHIAAVSRVYGEHATEVLHVLRNQPAAALPVILGRLRQKNLEWQTAQHSARGNWKQVMETNFAKSLDHRSFYFRQTEKKALSLRHMVAEVKERKDAIDAARSTISTEMEKEKLERSASNGDLMDVAPNGEETTAETAAQASLKAEAQGGHHENAMKAMRAAAPLLFSTTSMEGPKYRDLTLCDRNEAPAFCAPHHVLRYEDATVQQDAFLLLQHAVDASSQSPADRARMHHAFRHTFGLFFHFPPALLYKGRAVAPAPSSRVLPSRRYARDPTLNLLALVDTADLQFHPDLEAFVYPPEAHVLTLFGDAVVLDVLVAPAPAKEFSYRVRLSFGTATLQPEAVLRSLRPAALPPAAEAADAAFQDALTAAEAMVGGNGEEAGVAAMGGEDTPGHVENAAEGRLAPNLSLRKEVFFGTQAALGFFSLFALLCDRLSTARQLAKQQTEGGRQAPTAHPLKLKALDLQADFRIHSEDTPRARGRGAAEALTTAAFSPSPPPRTPSRGGAGRDAWDTPLSPLDLEAQRSGGLAAGFAFGGAKRSRNRRPWDAYHAFWLSLVSLLSGDTASATYEDGVRRLLGNRSYPLYTIDKLLVALVKQLHSVATDDGAAGLNDLFTTEALRHRTACPEPGTPAATTAVSSYRRRATAVLAAAKTRPEDLYRFEYCPGLAFRPELWRSEQDADAYTFVSPRRQRSAEEGVGMPPMEKLRVPFVRAEEGAGTALLLVEYLGPVAAAPTARVVQAADSMAALALAAEARNGPQDLSPAESDRDAGSDEADSALVETSAGEEEEDTGGLAEVRMVIGEGMAEDEHRHIEDVGDDDDDDDMDRDAEEDEDEDEEDEVDVDDTQGNGEAGAMILGKLGFGAAEAIDTLAESDAEREAECAPGLEMSPEVVDVLDSVAEAKGSGRGTGKRGVRATRGGKKRRRY